MKLVNKAKLRGYYLRKEGDNRYVLRRITYRDPIAIIENGEIQYVHPGFPFVIRVEGDAVVLTRKKGPATGSSS
jgi:hypothetical protein